MYTANGNSQNDSTTGNRKSINMRRKKECYRRANSKRELNYNDASDIQCERMQKDADTLLDHISKVPVLFVLGPCYTQLILCSSLCINIVPCGLNSSSPMFGWCSYY